MFKTLILHDQLSRLCCDDDNDDDDGDGIHRFAPRRRHIVGCDYSASDKVMPLEASADLSRLVCYFQSNYDGLPSALVMFIYSLFCLFCDRCGMQHIDEDGGSINSKNSCYETYLVLATLLISVITAQLNEFICQRMTMVCHSVFRTLFNLQGRRQVWHCDQLFYGND